MANRTVYVELKAKVDGYTSNINKAAKSTDAFSKAAKDAQRSSDTWNKVGLAGVALGAGVAVMAKKSIDAASNLAETVAKAGTVFGAAAGQITAFGDTAAQTLGMSKQVAIDAATTFAVFGKAAGLSGTELAGFSTQLTTLAADMASFSNTTPEQAIEAIGAALRGESEPIRAYGVMLDDAALKAEALAQGIYNGVGPLTQQQKVLAAQASILKQTSDAQGDVARTADGLANTQRRLNAEWADAQAGIGEALLPAATSAAEALGSMLDVFNGLPGPVKTGTLLVAGVGAAAMIATPKVMAFKAALAETGAISAGTNAKLATLGRGLGIAGAAAAAAEIAFTALHDPVTSLLGQDPASVEQFAAALRGLGEGSVDVSGMLSSVGLSIDGLGSAMNAAGNNGAAKGLIDGLQFLIPPLQALPEPGEKAAESFANMDAALMELMAGGNAAGAANAFNELAFAAYQQGKSVDELKSLLPQYTGAVGEAGTSSAQAAAKMTAAEEAATSYTDAVTALSEALAELGGKAKSINAATSDLEAAYDAARASVKEYGKTANGAKTKLDLTTKAGRENEASLRAISDAAMATAQSYAENGKSAGAIAAKTREARAQFVQVAKDMGLSGEAANDLADDYGLIPGKVKTAIETSGVEQAKADARAAEQAAEDVEGTYVITYETRYSGQGKPVMEATGGYITGPGTGTSDSIPAMLSNGEFIMRAAAVRRYGVGFMQALNAGAVTGFASGGLTDKQKARRAAKRDARAELAAAEFEARMAAKYGERAATATTPYQAANPVGEAQARLQREKRALRGLKEGSAAYIAQQARIVSARSTRNAARDESGLAAAAASAEAAAAAKVESDRITAENLAAKGSYDRAAFESSLRGMSAVEAASKRLEKSQGELAGLAEGSAEWYAKQEEILGNQNALADAQAQAQAEANAKQQAAIDAQKAKVEQLAQAWQQQTDAVQSALTSQASLLDSFDFGKATDAAAEMTAAEEELLAARRELNNASTEERAQALDRLAEAEKRVGDARAATAKAAPTFDNIMGGFQSKMQALSAFRGNIETLAKRGVHPSILQQLISSGVAGGAEMAAALVRFTPDQLGAINATQAQIETDANAIGQISANTMYGSAIMAAGQQLIQISGSQPIQLQLDSRQVYTGLLELARQSGGTLSWVTA